MKKKYSKPGSLFSEGVRKKVKEDEKAIRRRDITRSGSVLREKSGSKFEVDGTRGAV